VPLAAGANVLRVVDDVGVRVRDVSRRAAISPEVAKWSMGVLEHGYVTVEPDPQASRGKVVRLTPEGATVQQAYGSRAAAIEERWAGQFSDVVTDLRSALEEIVELDDGVLLRSGLVAPDGCWRAGAPRPDGLPHFPLAMHRGGYPDGA
jgi:hypothetical protein